VCVCVFVITTKPHPGDIFCGGSYKKEVLNILAGEVSLNTDRFCQHNSVDEDRHYMKVIFGYWSALTDGYQKKRNTGSREQWGIWPFFYF